MAQAQGLLTKGIELQVKEGQTYINLDSLQETPELGGEAEKVEVTCLSDGAKRYINGIVDYGDLAFKFLYDSAEGSSYRKLRALEEAGTIHEFKVVFPDEVEFGFRAGVTTKIDSGAVNGALAFTANLALNSEMTVTFPTAASKNK